MFMLLLYRQAGAGAGSRIFSAIRRYGQTVLQVRHVAILVQPRFRAQRGRTEALAIRSESDGDSIENKAHGPRLSHFCSKFERRSKRKIIWPSEARQKLSNFVPNLTEIEAKIKHMAERSVAEALTFLLQI